MLHMPQTIRPCSVPRQAWLWLGQVQELRAGDCLVLEYGEMPLQITA